MRSRSAFSLQATSDESRFCKATPRYLMMALIATASALGAYRFTSADQSWCMTHLHSLTQTKRAASLSRRPIELYMPCAFMRLLHSLQYCGHFWPGWIFPAAFASRHSLPQARSRSIIAWRPGLPFASPADFGAAIGVVAGAAFATQSLT